MIEYKIIDPLIMLALKEDMPQGDITTDNLIDENSVSQAKLIAKESGVIAGLGVAERVFKLLDENIEFKFKVTDGTQINEKDIIAEIKGNTAALLKGERTALNFLQHMSGVATKTRKFAELTKPYSVKVADTRKTLPGLRYIEKYSVTVGGGMNHRYSLSDVVLIKDNHIEAVGGIKKAVEKIREQVSSDIKIEVETQNIEQVKEALDARANIIMLDNMSVELMKQAVEIISKKAIIEASGNVNIDTIKNIAETKVDYISIGELTHSVKAFDRSMDFC